MRDDNEFQIVGKKTPYKVPGDFFEKISEKTLLLAKLQDQKLRKNRVLWRTVSVAASLAAALFLGYMILYPGTKPESNMLVQEKQSTGQQLNRQKQEISEQSTVPLLSIAEPEKVPAKKITATDQTDDLSAVLADLTDDELQQMVAMLKTDPFISESGQ